MAQILPIKELRDTNKISQICNASDNPIYITKNGYGDMVIMSMTVYEKKLAQLEMYQYIMDGKKQAENGELINGKTFLAELKNKYDNE